MTKSATFENLPYYTRKTGISNNANTGKLVLFVFWVIGATSFFTTFIRYSPSHFSNFKLRQQHYQKTASYELGLKNTTLKNLNQTTAIVTDPEKGIENDEKPCDLFEGRWIPDLNGSLYTNWSCPTIPDWKDCPKHGRKDLDYMNWRWKPNRCELPRFNPEIFLSIVRGKKLAFIGDSVARNQMESLLCLLSQGETPRDMYKDSDDRFRTFYFPSHDFTLMVYWVRFLVVAEEIVVNGSATGAFNIHLDKVDNNWDQRLPGLDYAIISDAHWFFRKHYLYEGGKLIGCIYCDEPNVPELGVLFAINKAFGTALKSISDCNGCRKGLLTLLRTFSPAHFENGSWNGGGTCNRISPYTEEQVNFASMEWELRGIQVKAVENIEKKEGKRFEILDITRAMMMRPDGHQGLMKGNQYLKEYSDCVHWCLPGPIDVWNDLLMASDVEKKCVLFKGRWIPDLNGSLYTNWSCPTMLGSKNCRKHGRKDVDYMNWRWKPNECELPRFNPETFLSVVRGKKLGETSKDVYKDSEDGFRTFYFPSHDFTLMVYWVRFLVVAEEKGINGTTKTDVFDIHLDKIDISWAQRLRDLDYAVISDAHWFFRKNYLYEGGRQIGCIYCNEPNVPDLGVPFAVGKAFGSVLEYINDCKECKKGLVTLLRTFSPAHFEHGSWNGGGTCNRTSPYTEEQVNLASTEMELRSVQVKEFEKIKKRKEGKRFEILDITRAMIMRPDGHPDLHWDNQYTKGHSDCVHWCLPGPIDVWNDLLMAVLQKEDGHSTHSSS
ncbi:hypothetical protein MKW98_017925 [Papaver atlanticum]|uniref:Trichome birefringence-like N-terminal domain-containing protein n=1 Tax=Papaver atlanticum TaxID=357466 RepID=A0AAD4TFF8_9MAGN|nr:hypothetical protein MKW98_017925 [Papaver atlanticum]